MNSIICEAQADRQLLVGLQIPEHEYFRLRGWEARPITLHREGVSLGHRPADRSTPWAALRHLQG